MIQIGSISAFSLALRQFPVRHLHSLWYIVYLVQYTTPTTSKIVLNVPSGAMWHPVDYGSVSDWRTSPEKNVTNIESKSNTVDEPQYFSVPPSSVPVRVTAGTKTEMGEYYPVYV